MRAALLLVLAVTLVSLPATGAHPQGSPANRLTFSYRDDRGAGQLTIVDLGEDKATGGRQIQVALTLNGVQYRGSGITLQLEDRMPFPTLIVFSLVGRRGATEFYQGKTISGITVSGQGVRYRPTFPERKSDWSIVLGGPTGSGIRGVAMAGPISPVERPGVPNTRPLPGAIITLQPAGGGKEITRRRADENGRFEIPLSPGTYLLVPLPPQPDARLPRGRPQTVTVRAGQFTDVVVEYDTGIR